MIPLCCPLCGGIPFDGKANSLCAECFSKLDFIHAPFCRSCGGELNGILETCHDCTVHPRPWDAAFSVFRMDGDAKELLHSFKYQAHLELARFMGRLAASKIGSFMREKDVSIDYIVPVPLHWTRFLMRGFNQSNLISSVISGELDIPVGRFLKRKTATKQQAHLNRIERMKNLKHAFHVNNSTILEKRAILLVDDVMTTGSTLEAATEAVFKAGAAHVYVLTLARRM